jgi:hypothetical protein
MLGCFGFDTVESKNQLGNRLFTPQCAVIIKGSDTFGGRNKIRAAFLVTLLTNCIMAVLAGPLFQEGNGSVDLATATVANDKNTNNEMM